MRPITLDDLININYYQVPKWLMEKLLKNEITLGAFKVYVLMYDRLRLSFKNNWHDSDGLVYIKYSYNDLLEDLHSNSKTTISNSIKELEEINLISKKKNFSSGTNYYLNMYDGTEDSTTISTENCTNDISTKNCTNISTENCTDISTKNCTTISTKNCTLIKINNNNKLSKNIINNNKLYDQLEKENISEELKEKLIEFIEFRKEIKKSIKSYQSIKMIINKLGKDFVDENHLIESIDQSIMNGYQGVFPTKQFKTVNKPSVEDSYTTKWLKNRGLL